ncbi:hypothetical protein BC629DRAFT_295124 [Irpex lacteus]|nr:hypothetical protein BC629DRAFT_295124 [Irpex lacteus]
MHHAHAHPFITIPPCCVVLWELTDLSLIGTPDHSRALNSPYCSVISLRSFWFSLLIVLSSDVALHTHSPVKLLTKFFVGYVYQASRAEAKRGNPCLRSSCSRLNFTCKLNYRNRSDVNTTLCLRSNKHAYSVCCSPSITPQEHLRHGTTL